ncbi:MAG: COX15/CtaA family protein [Alphaproteobacteria bacterium]|nr:COX15/CtaA family protein [Alphaproteobacteria bacterium]MDP6815024.1 COX15/CtaA family protein [Alphaproteobacteria bacterium]
MTRPDDPEPAPGKAQRSRRAVAIWLLCVAAMVAAMVLLGGATRLTHSGLSMVQWQPLMGVLPPLGQEEWQETFEKYKQYPEYQKLNRGMSLEEFKGIFYYEYSHRVLGRGISLVFAVPFLVFLLSGRLERRRLPSLVGLFLLGGLQGLIGWWMVKSGLVDRPDVSQYRLTVHFGVAVVILGALIWVALDLLLPPSSGSRAPRVVVRWTWVALALVFLQALSGGLVAGLDGGFVYNTFPMMDEHWLPPELGLLSPWWLNAFENEVTAQFNHRIGAYVTALVLLALWFKARLAPLGPQARLALHLMLAALVGQLLLGVFTLILLVPLSLAILHQGGALVLFAVVLYALHRLQHEGAAA